eukprot:14634-Heterococcus_DN1.PRE.1
MLWRSNHTGSAQHHRFLRWCNNERATRTEPIFLVVGAMRVLHGCAAATLASLASGFGLPVAPTGCTCTMNAEHTTSRRNMIVAAAPIFASAVLSQAALAVDNNAAPGGRTSFDSVSTQVPPSGKEQAPLSDVPFRNLPSGVKIK